jgi:hypothetical protein
VRGGGRRGEIERERQGAREGAREGEIETAKSPLYSREAI